MKKYKMKKWLKIVVSLVLVLAVSMTVVIPGMAETEKVGRFGDVVGSDGKFIWTEKGKEKTLNYFYVGEAAIANQAYCIDHATALNDGTVRVGTECDLNKGSDFWKSYSVGAQKGIMYTLLYGYNGKDNRVPDKLKALDKNISTMDYLAATQFLIWEYTLGYRTNAASLQEPLFYNCIKGRRAEVAYNYILKQIAAHEIKASFLSPANNQDDVPSYVMSWNEDSGRYEVTITDENNNSFVWQIISEAGINVSQQGNEYTFYTDKKQDNTLISLKKQIEKGVIASDNSFRLVVFDGDGQALTRGKWDPLSYYMTFTTEPDGAIEIQKTSDDDVVKDVNFTISGKNIAVPITKATDENGVVKFEGLKPGSYIVTEVLEDDKYLSPEPVTVEVKSGETATLSFHNKVAEYSFKIKKYVMDTPYSPDCATFTFRVTGGALTEPLMVTTHWIGTKDNSQVGEVTVLVPGPGTYTIEETDTGGKYIGEFMAGDEIIVESDGHNGSVWVKNTPKKGGILVTKTSEDGQVHGIPFVITGENLYKPLTLYTDEFGYIMDSLPYGTYTITEQVPSKYMPVESQTFTVGDGMAPMINFHNVLKRGTIRIVKTSDTGAVSGRKFVITAADGGAIFLKDGTMTSNVELTTDHDGVAVAEDLPLGKYKIVEGDNGVAYETIKPREVTLTEKDVEVSVDMHNTLKKGSVLIKKSSEDGNLAGHKFIIYGKVFDPEGPDAFSVKDFSAEGVTDAEGYIAFRVPVNIVSVNGQVYKASEEGFTVKEITQDRYEEVAPFTNIFVTENEVANGGAININNVVRKGNVRVVKKSEDGKVSEKEFQLTGKTYYGTSVSIKAKTDENGILVFENLAPADENGYTLTEINVPDYYIPPEAVVVHVKAGETFEVTFENVLKRGSVKVIKTSEDGFVEGREFSLTGTSASGEKIDLTASTDEKGVAVFKDVLISSTEGYILSEKNVPIKYQIPSDKNVVVHWDKTESVEVHNVLKKIDSPVVKTDQKGNVLEGAGLAVYTEDNQLVFAGLTDENGRLTGLKLTVCKKYFVKEFLAPVGYVLDETLRSFQVLEDGSVEGDYSFVNEPQPTPTPEPTPEVTPSPTPVPFVFEPPVEPETPKPTGSPSPTLSEHAAPPETGDDNNIRTYVIIASVAVVMGVIVMIIIRKRMEESEGVDEE